MYLFRKLRNNGEVVNVLLAALNIKLTSSSKFG